MMVKYEVGKVYPEAIMHQEVCIFDLNDSGGTMMVYFNRPEAHEIEQFESGKRFEIRFVSLNDVIMMLVKVGDLSWMDAPYTPHLSPQLTTLDLPPENYGMTLIVQLFDSSTGRLVSQKLISFSTDFTRRLYSKILALQAERFDKDKYNKTLSAIYQRYTTKELLKMSTPGFKINA